MKRILGIYSLIGIFLLGVGWPKRELGYYDSKEKRYYLPNSRHYVESENYHLIKDTINQLLNMIDTSAMKKKPFYKQVLSLSQQKDFVVTQKPGVSRDFWLYGFHLKKCIFCDDGQRNLTIGFLNDSTLYIENIDYLDSRMPSNVLCFIDIYRASIGKIDSLIATTRKNTSQNCEYRMPCDMGYYKVNEESEIFPILNNEVIHYNVRKDKCRIRDFMFTIVDE